MKKKIEAGDVEAITEAKLVLAEMDKTKVEIDALIAQYRS
jgi:hypothetical protein